MVFFCVVKTKKMILILSQKQRFFHRDYLLVLEYINNIRQVLSNSYSYLHAGDTSIFLSK